MTPKHQSDREPHSHHHHRHGQHHYHPMMLAAEFAEAAVAAPFVIAGSILHKVKRCVTSVSCGTWCDICSTCGCGCRCGHEERDCPSADISIETRMGEIREKVILVENNGPHPATITLEADPWMDTSGKPTTSSIVFHPSPTVTLSHCQTSEIFAKIDVNQPLEEGKTYFTRIYLRGCSRKPIFVELRVAGANKIDYYAECESCRPRCGDFVEVCCEHGHDHHHGCGNPRCGKCHPHRFDPFRWLCSPWLGIEGCERFMLPRHAGMRACH